VLLQQHGWLVMRCLAEDVVIDLERIVHEIEAVLARRAVPTSHPSR
jgi:very-short-patch-repair endonuclease